MARDLGTPVTIRQPSGATFRGCTCLSVWWPLLNRMAVKRGIVRQQVDVTQQAYNTSVKASARTHHGGGVLDLAQDSQALDDLLEEAGAAAYRRDYRDGMLRHIHMILIGCPHLHPQAANQVDAWRNRRNALVSNRADRDQTRPSPIRTWSQGVQWMTAQLAPAPIPAIVKPSPTPIPSPEEDDMPITDAEFERIHRIVEGARNAVDTANQARIDRYHAQTTARLAALEAAVVARGTVTQDMLDRAVARALDGARIEVQ